MFRRRFFRSSSTFLATSILSLMPHSSVRAEEGNLMKKLRESMMTRPNLNSETQTGFTNPPRNPNERYPWRVAIVTTTFWVGERPTRRNPVPNFSSSWDKNWAENYGGSDDPDSGGRADYCPVGFIPQQNPFYFALPYNDVTKGQHKPEAAKVIPWFQQAYQGPGKTVLKDRWIAIRFKDRVAYAQWEDCGPFRTDHWQYVFGNDRPKPNLNRGAGLDVSPAVRDFLGMNDSDVTDWKFVEFSEVPHGPWALHGENNNFVINERSHQSRVVELQTKPSGTGQ